MFPLFFIYDRICMVIFMNKKSKLIFLISLFIVGCEKVEDPILLSHIVPGDFIDDEFVFPMNTITTLRMYYKSQYEQVVNEFDNIVISLSKEVDRYHDYEQINNLKTINDSCGSDTFINVSDELFELIKLSIDITKLSEGKFNLAMGNIIDLYSSKISEELSGREDTLFEQELINQYVANIPSYEIIDEVIELDYENKAVKLNKYNENNVIISLGAIAKGFVMQKAYDYLKEFNYPALFDAGSSTMATIGQKPSDNPSWGIAFSAPVLQGSEQLTTISLSDDNFISTSGDNQQYFKYKDENNNTRLMHHIIDPYTGISNNYLRSATLFSKDAHLDLLDSLSTILFNCHNDEESLSIIDLYEETFNCDISFVLTKPYIENNVVSYEYFDLVVSSSFEEIRNSDYNERVKKYIVLENY